VLNHDGLALLRPGDGQGVRVVGEGARDVLVGEPVFVFETLKEGFRVLPAGAVLVVPEKPDLEARGTEGDPDA
jgi:hypothetical protein